MNQKIVCSVFRSERKEGAYLYVKASTEHVNLRDLPEELCNSLGKLTEVMKLSLNPTRKLANADIKKVLQSLEAQGYYLQLPPLNQADIERKNL